MLLKRWIPAAVLVATFFLSVVLWQALVRSERAALSNHTESTASVAREFLRDELESHAESLSNLVKRWQSSEIPVEAAWLENTAFLLENKPEFAAIVWAGSDREVRSSIPSKDALPVDFAFNKALDGIFASASQTWSPVISPPVKLTSGRTAFIIAVPIWYGGEFKGLIAGILDSREFIANVLNDARHELDGYVFAITSGKAELYRNAATPDSALALELPIDASGAEWKLSVWPGRKLADSYITALPTAVFALGSVSSLLFATLIYFAQVNRQKNADLENANEMLKAEVRQRARTEEELRRSDEKFRGLVETMTDLIWEADEDGRYTYVSPRALDLLGYGPEEVLGKRLWEFMAATEGERFKEAFFHSAKAREPFSFFESMDIRKDGTRVALETSALPVFDKEGACAGYRGVHRDVTQRKEARDALKKSNERLENAQRIARLGGWDWDIENDDLHWSDEIYRIFGVEPREFGATYEAFLGFVHPEDRMAVHRNVTEAMTLRKPYSIEHRIVLADGTVKVVQENGDVRFNQAGSPVAMSGTVQDITERKQVDEQLRLYRDHLRELVEERTADLHELNEKLKFEVEIRKKAEEAVISMNEDLEKRAVELERVNKELEAFTYSASHDLQEPLRVISGYVQLLGRRYKGRLDKDADEFISYAVDGVARMQRLISDLLSYSRVGRLNALSPVDFEAALLRAKANLRVAIEESGAVVRHGDLPTVLADESQIDQLLMNLLNNAIKYRGKDTPLVTVNATKEGGEWLFSVSDNGIGLDPKYSEKVFEIFQRLHGSGEYPGTGIGLSICKKVVENHGGRIWVESLPGAGSTFYFTIPGKEAANA
ncbi:MAG: PAS domain S-box protein [Deltaproteobacteria bacterium]|nr:PAS domain S-box protein [Deltaproteobacteria bacterium]